MKKIFFSIRILIGLIFIISGFEKVTSPYQNFLAVIQDYEVLPYFLEEISARVIPWVELSLGILIILGLWLKISLTFTSILFACFIGFIGQALIRNLGLEGNVIFTGIRNDIPQILNIIDIFVLPSLKEGLPIALLEAMAAKKPVIATRVGAIADVIEDRKTGLLIDPADKKEIFESIKSLLGNKEKANLLAENGYKKIKDEFSAENMAKEYIESYRGISHD